VGRLDCPQLLVAQHRLQRIETGVGVQYKDPVEAGLRFGLGMVDGKMAGARGLQKTAIAGIADQRLVAALQLPGEAVENGPPLGRVALCLLFVATDDIAPSTKGDRFGAVVDLVAARVLVSGTNGAGSLSTMSRTSRSDRSRVPRM
jgi:hypothetical protein